MVLRPTIAFHGPAAPVLVSLPTLTRAYLSDEGRRYITTFMKMAPDDPRATELIAQFARKFAAPKVSAVAGKPLAIAGDAGVGALQSVGRGIKNVVMPRRSDDKNNGILGGAQ